MHWTVLERALTVGSWELAAAGRTLAAGALIRLSESGPGPGSQPQQTEAMVMQ